MNKLNQYYFFRDYLAVMPNETGKTEQRVSNMIKLLKHRKQIKTNEIVLTYVIIQLELYLSITQDACFRYNANRLIKLFNMYKLNIASSYSI